MSLTFQRVAILKGLEECQAEECQKWTQHSEKPRQMGNVGVSEISPYGEGARSTLLAPPPVTSLFGNEVTT
jgi:hypothetical protein